MLACVNMHSNECNSRPQCTKWNTFTRSVKPKAPFLLTGVGDESVSNTAHWCIFSVQVCFVYKLEEAVWCMILWPLRNQEDAPFLWCVLYTGVTQASISWAFFSNTADTSVHWINVLDMSSRILSHICQARTLLWWCVSSLWGEQGPISHSWEIG